MTISKLFLLLMVYVCVLSAKKYLKPQNKLNMLSSLAQFPHVFKPCITKQGIEKRKLTIVTCDTQEAKLSYTVWNTTGATLRSSGVSMVNVCNEKKWSGFLVKPSSYLDFVNKLTKIIDNPYNYVMLMDSDTFWTISSVADIWSRFDCARGYKKALISTEMSCWIGGRCRINNLRKYYGIPGKFPSTSPFVNSGVIMGHIDIIKRMLEYIIMNNASFFQPHKNGYHFHDQYAVTHYTRVIAPELYALDYHQQLVGSFAVVDSREGNTDYCYLKNGSWVSNCCVVTKELMSVDYFQVNQSNCQLYRNFWPGIVLADQVESLAPYPAIWHGNGRGKGAYQKYSRHVMECLGNKTVKSTNRNSINY